VTIATDIYFSGFTCWGTQLLLSVITLAEATRLYLRPQQLYTEESLKLITWNFAGASIYLDVDFLYLRDSLVSKAGYYRRVLPFTPLNALDLGIDRDNVADFTGFAIPNDLMISRGLISLEERTAYLIQAKAVRDSLIAEWNLFADIQQSLWITILYEESAQTLPLREINTLTNYFDPTAPGDIAFGTQIVHMPPAYIRNVDRTGYEDAITQWLLDSGTTTRSGGVAVSNDTYVNWLSGLLADCLADIGLIPKHPIDPREVYKFAPRLILAIGSDGSDGITGLPDTGKADPADDKQSKALDLLEELASRGNNLTATLNSPAAQNIDTLPEC
jgi:hypothetical protein